MSDPGADVTRCKTGPCQCILVIFYKICHILLAKSLAATMFAFCGFLCEAFLFHYIKPFKDSVLLFPDFSNFVYVRRSITW